MFEYMPTLDFIQNAIKIGFPVKGLVKNKKIEFRLMTFRIYKSDRTDPMSLFGTHPSELWSTRADAPQKSSKIHRMVNALPGVNHRWKLFESNVKRYQSIKTMNDKAGDLDVDRGESYLEVRDSEDGDNLLHSAIEVLAKLDGEC